MYRVQERAFLGHSYRHHAPNLGSLVTVKSEESCKTSNLHEDALSAVRSGLQASGRRFAGRQRKSEIRTAFLRLGTCASTTDGVSVNSLPAE